MRAVFHVLFAALPHEAELSEIREASFPSKYFRMIVSTPSSRARSMMTCPASVASVAPVGWRADPVSDVSDGCLGESLSMRSATKTRFHRSVRASPRAVGCSQDGGQCQWASSMHSKGFHPQHPDAGIAGELKEEQARRNHSGRKRRRGNVDDRHSPPGHSWTGGSRRREPEVCHIRDGLAAVLASRPLDGFDAQPLSG